MGKAQTISPQLGSPRSDKDDSTSSFSAFGEPTSPPLAPFSLKVVLVFVENKMKYVFSNFFVFGI
jgi:hypothetical protein